MSANTRLYLAAAPEYGKQTFYQRLEREIARAKQHFPEARYWGSPTARRATGASLSSTHKDN